MITINNGTAFLEFRGLSSDTKPMVVPNGSVFLEMDTGDVYIFDKQNEQWLPLGE